MNNLQQKAVENFRAGYNCAQSVLTTFSDDLKMDKNAALSISCGFGAGMGRLQETCGAATGSYMVIGLHTCRKYSDNKERKENSYALIREFEGEFKKLHGTSNCAELLKIDLKTPEGQKTFHDEHLNQTVCEQCIADSVEILSNILR